MMVNRIRCAIFVHLAYLLQMCVWLMVYSVSRFSRFKIPNGILGIILIDTPSLNCRLDIPMEIQPVGECVANY